VHGNIPEDGRGGIKMKDADYRSIGFDEIAGKGIFIAYAVIDGNGPITMKSGDFSGSVTPFIEYEDLGKKITGHKVLSTGKTMLDAALSLNTIIKDRELKKISSAEMRMYFAKEIKEL
jgi:hypothetical protein